LQYFISANPKPPEVLEGHIKGGTPVSPAGVRYGVNSLCFTRSGKPWFPVMGEIHFSRYPRDQWEEAILMMKAGGIRVIASYIFWIHHEEEQGKFDWSGNRDLRHFIELCGKHGLAVWLRIGPWCHGEARNGGFPDWLSRVSKPRTMDPAYFLHVRRWYGQVAAQARGLYHKDGGPVIGIQFDNEYGHVGGAGGDDYIMECKKIALEFGMDPPYYTVTGWGSAAVPKDEVIPVFGAYPDAPWEDGHDRLSPTYSHAFMDLYDTIGKTNIGSDLVLDTARKAHLKFDPSRYPYGTAELGAGNQVRYPRRPIFTTEDGEAVIVTKLGEGAAMLGYYMYHGGSNPLGKLTTLEEPGYPVISYDFHAPLGEYGKAAPAYFGLKRIHQFLDDFGGGLAAMRTVLPAGRAIAADAEPLRYALRSDRESGYLIINNHQRYMDMPAREDLRFSVELKGETISFPGKPVTIRPSVTAIWPVNIDLDGMRLKYATAMPLMRLGAGRFVFAATPGVTPELGFDEEKVVKPAPGEAVAVEVGGKRVEVMVLTPDMALKAWKVKMEGADRMAVCDAELMDDQGTLKVRARTAGNLPMLVYPATSGSLTVAGKPVSPEPAGAFTRYQLPFGPDPAVEAGAKPAEIPESDAKYPFPPPIGQPKAWRITVDPASWAGASDLIMRILYVGDTARLYLDGMLVADDFWCGKPWEIGLRRWREELLKPDAELVLVISPWKRDQKVFTDVLPMLSGEATLVLSGIEIEPERTLAVALP
jgi:hypothetical protein